MEEQQMNPNRPTRPSFNLALLLGLFAIAISIFAAGQSVAGRMPHSFHGHLSGTLTNSGHFHDSAREFMSEWEAANFLMMGHDEFTGLLQSGELSGTYTVFQVERREWRWSHDELSRMVHPPTPSPGIRVSGQAEYVRPVPVPTEYDIVLADHRVFSWERLTEWLLGRIDR